MKHDSVTGFYFYSDNKHAIGISHADDRHTIGPNLKQALDWAKYACSYELGHMYVREGDPGSEYVAHRRLFSFADNHTDEKAQVYELIVCSRGSWAQYMSAVFKGDFDERIFRSFHDRGFTQKHSFLEKESHFAPRIGITGLWLDDIVEFESMMPK